MQFTFRHVPPLPSSPFTCVGVFTIERNEIAASGRRQKQHTGTEAMHNGVRRAEWENDRRREWFRMARANVAADDSVAINHLM